MPEGSFGPGVTPPDLGSSGIGGARGAMADVIIRILGDASDFLAKLKQAEDALEETAQTWEGLAAKMAKSFEKPARGIQEAFNYLYKVRHELERFEYKTFGVSGVEMMSIHEFTRIALEGLWRAGKLTAEQVETIANATRVGLPAGFRKTADAAEGATKSIGLFGASLGKAFAAAAILRKAIQALTRHIKESIEEFRLYTVEFFRFEVGIRAAQRQMGAAAGSIAEWDSYLNELSERFQIFSKRDLTAAISKIILLTRELGFSKDQMKQVTEASLILAEVSGVTVAEASRRLALFLDTGVSRGLQALGVQVTKATVEQYALAQGVEKAWNEMTRQERAALSLGAIMEQVGDLQEDAGRIAETYAGQMMKLQTEQQNAMLETGKNVQAFALAWERIKTFFVKLVPRITSVANTLVKLWILAVAGMTAPWVAFATTIVKIVDTLKRGAFLDLTTLVFDFKQFTVDAFNGIVVQLQKKLLPGVSELGDVAADEMGKFSETMEEGERAVRDFNEAVQDSIDDIEDAFRDLADKQEDAFRRMQDRLEDLATDFAYDLVDAARELGEDLAEINRKAGERAAKEIEKAKRAEEDIIKDTNQKIADAQAKFRMDELAEQRRFNLEMEQLERRYLFDLEDAVRERDARRILELMRRHALARQEMEEEFRLRREAAERELRYRIEMIKREGLERRAALRRQLALRLKEIEAQRVRERADRRREYQRELEELIAQNQRRREEIQLDYERRLRDLQIYHNRRLEEIGRNLAKELELNRDGAEKVINIWAQAFNDMATIMSAISGLRAGAIFGSATGPRYSYGSINPSLYSRVVGSAPFAGGFQHGGSVIANRPTLALFGERGPEMATFTPLGRGGGQKIELVVKPDDRLIVEVADRAMDEMADVIVNIERGLG